MDNHEKATHQEMSFETAMEKLEHIVEQLESGEVLLEKAIELFQEGMGLSGLCARKLEQVERKIEVLSEQNGELRRQPFPAEEAGDRIE
ncbi:exodeoxyribonuclease VII small subunit [Paenibacillus popilliae]|uniref:Exodeoxyribonuclease 7 small subunit n=1 Tax=Paenibacillus popilliae ATCC 14706 TaxID=1212764 RepID=M9LQC7_PAEPP|nr:exodeoxyribonuclease VII small subunit [Paenibacillus popilliae]GAC43026.1 exonuclease VII [Paenibacillus popilliae ATCC 14706]